MSAAHPTPDALGRIRTAVEEMAAPACLRDRDGHIVASNPAAHSVWQSEKRGGPPGFLAIRDTTGLAWKGWFAEENLAPCVLTGERLDGSLVEYLAFPSLIRNAAGDGEGVLEIFVPLSAATIPRSLIHGLSNALGVILGNVDLALLDIAPDQEAAENLREIRSAALGARSLVREGAVPETSPVQAAPEPPAPKRVMCIDDEEAFLLLAERALRRLGCEVRVQVSADEGLREHAGNPLQWDLVVIDNNLLGREGLEVAAAFLSQNPNQCICIASGVVDAALEERARGLGVRRVIQKPATVAEFAEAFGGLLSGLATRPPGPP
jgi:CheY-like chemotaxis protein